MAKTPNRRRIPADKVEQYVGAKRHPTDHIARADHGIQQIAILHSAECLAWIERNGYDLLHDCEYSQALDLGIIEASWPDLTPLPIKFDLDGRLIPASLDPAAAVGAV